MYRILVNDQREHLSSSTPLIVLVNDQGEHPSSSSPLMFLSQSRLFLCPGNSTCVTDVALPADAAGEASEAGASERHLPAAPRESREEALRRVRARQRPPEAERGE